MTAGDPSYPLNTFSLPPDPSSFHYHDRATDQYGSPGQLPLFVHNTSYAASSTSLATATATNPPPEIQKSPWRTRWDNWTKGWRFIVFNSWLNILLLFFPVAWVLSKDEVNRNGFLFIFCLLPLPALVKLHELTTMELAARIGGTKTGLLNATMANIIEVVVAFSALQKCELRVVQSSLIGSMLSKLLLILGLCFFAGGLRFTEQAFDAAANQINSSLLTVSVGALMLPVVYHFALSGTLTGTTMDDQAQSANILRMSHGVAIVLIIIYMFYLVFQLWSHTHLFKDSRVRSQENHKTAVAFKFVKKDKKKVYEGSPAMQKNLSGLTLTSGDSDDSVNDWKNGPSRPPPTYDMSRNGSMIFESPVDEKSSYSMYPLNGETASPGPSNARLVNRFDSSTNISTRSTLGESQFKEVDLRASRFVREEERLETSGSSHSIHGLLTESRDSTDVIEDPKPTISSLFGREARLSVFLTLTLLVLDTIAVSMLADWIVESLDHVSDFIRKEWVALILLPAVSSIAECITAINVSVQDQVTFSIAVAVGSSIQTALFVIPLMVLVAWATGKPLTMLFDPFESLVLYISVQSMGQVVADGRSNWLEGIILMGLYGVIAVSFWFYPGSSLTENLSQCT